MFIFIIIVIAVILFIAKGKSLDAARARNSIVSLITGEEGFCCECKHCRKDTSRRYSDTDWFCSLSKCHHITPETRMNCFEKPKVTEEDLQELFTLGVWTKEGQQYIRQTILGKAMTFSEVDQVLKDIPNKHPEYIDPDYVAKNR
ncbi:MAG: hypothetical protein Q4C50_01310 [Eubacteriales bacterium]|nr:hypothetical protein [Eubacteriales bacterium]